LIILVSGIREEVIGPPPPTWTSADELCKSENCLLCSAKDLFPEPGIFYSSKNFDGIEWVPIR